VPIVARKGDFGNGRNLLWIFDFLAAGDLWEGKIVDKIKITVIPAKAGIPLSTKEIPAFAGMTNVYE